MFPPTPTCGAPGRPGAPSGYRSAPGRAGYRGEKWLYDTGSGIGMLIASAHGKTFCAQAFCDSMIFANSGLFADSVVTMVSQAFSCASTTDCGVLMILTPRSSSFLWSVLFFSIQSHSPSGDSA